MKFIKCVTVSLCGWVLLMPQLALAQDGASESLDALINNFFSDFTGPFVGLIFHSVEFAGTSFPLIVGWL